MGSANSSAIDTNCQSTMTNSYQIFRLLLNYEAEQRAYFPEKYQDLSWLKDQQHKLNWIPLKHAEEFDKSPGKEVVEELKKALQEQEIYYQECLEAQAKGIPLMPYHKKFLPKNVQEQKEKTWSEKISESPNSSLRHRSKSDEPLQTKQEAAMKPISRSSDTLTKPEEEQPLLNHNGHDEDSFVSRLMGWFVSNPGSDKVKGL